MFAQFKKGLASNVCIFALGATSTVVNAAYVSTSTINITGGFDIACFDPLQSHPGTVNDFDLFTYTLTLTNVSGVATYDVPPAGYDLDDYATGNVGFDAGGGNVIGGSFFNELFYSGLSPITGISSQEFTFDFDNQEVSSMTGGFSFPVPLGLPTSINATYEILALDIDGLFNDVVINMQETNIGDPVQTLAAALKSIDDTNLDDGKIDGEFGIQMTVTAVPEPSSIGLISLALMLTGLTVRRKVKNNA